ncbi:cytochrome b [Inquilinus limosus]|uniref:cytochrome b n=1 Tax=Inquilinus limosus TaxID=171674 RepID=UPI0004194BAB|nr:cytochrome b [Inquilinus limosus]
MNRNTAERWGRISIALHWTIAGLILLVQIPAGLTMNRVEPGLVQNILYDTHKMTGLTVFALAVVRLIWRWANPVPELPADLPRWQAVTARTTHALLYLLIFAMPISGFLYTAMGGFPVPLFYLVDLADFVPENKPAAEVAKAVHLSLKWVLLAVVVLHVAGALQHHLVRRDGILRRMLSSKARLPDAGRQAG